MMSTPGFALSDPLRFERLLSELFATPINVAPEKTDEIVRQALAGSPGGSDPCVPQLPAGEGVADRREVGAPGIAPCRSP
jgi:hypothetical protein